MSQAPDPLSERKAKRSKLIGRLILVALGLLLLAQMIPFMMRA